MPRLACNDTALGTTRAARYLGVHRSTLKSWRTRGVIRAEIVESRYGPRYKFSRADLDALRKKIEYED